MKVIYYSLLSLLISSFNSQSWQTCGALNPTGVSQCFGANTLQQRCCYVSFNNTSSCYYFSNNSTYYEKTAELNLNGFPATVDCRDSLQVPDLNEFFGVPYCSSNGGLITNSTACLGQSIVSTSNPCCSLSVTFTTGILKGLNLTTCLQTTTDFFYSTLGTSLFQGTNAVLNCSDSLTITAVTLSSNSIKANLFSFIFFAIIIII